MVAAQLMGDVAYRHLSTKKTKTAVLGQILFLALALIIPSLTHRLGLNYLVAQPMHWMILFSGLAYGPLSGMLLGFAVPLASALITGMPIPSMLPLMIPELAVYGFAAGFFKQKLTAFGSIALALVAGRLVFLSLLAFSGGLDVSVAEYARTTWLPGIAVVLLQITLLPFLSGLYVNWAKD
jgi:hypothetical protein